MSKKITPATATKTAAKPAKKTTTTTATATSTATKAVKAAAPVAAVTVLAPVIAPVVADPVRAMDRSEFEAIVRTEAHGLALARGFRNGNPFGDWVRAEATVLSRLAAEGRTVARSTDDAPRS